MISTWKLAEKHPHNKKAILRHVGEEEKWFCKKLHARAESIVGKDLLIQSFRVRDLCPTFLTLRSCIRKKVPKASGLENQ